MTELKENSKKTTNPVKFSKNALPTAINKEPTILKDYFTFANLPKDHSVHHFTKNIFSFVVPIKEIFLDFFSEWNQLLKRGALPKYFPLHICHCKQDVLQSAITYQ